MPPSDATLHASCATRGPQGVLLLGASGSGKSDLLLRLLGAGYDLVADDRVMLDGLTARAPAALAGLMEVRGVGIVRRDFVIATQIALVVQLDSSGIDRLPGPDRHTATGAPLLKLDPREASAVAKIGIVLDCLAGTCELCIGILDDDLLGSALPRGTRSPDRTTAPTDDDAA